jgi:hypothetical protein
MSRLDAGISSGGDWDLFASFYQKDPQEPRDGFTANGQSRVGTEFLLQRRASIIFQPFPEGSRKPASTVP